MWKKVINKQKKWLTCTEKSHYQSYNTKSIGIAPKTDRRSKVFGTQNPQRTISCSKKARGDKLVTYVLHLEDVWKWIQTYKQVHQSTISIALASSHWASTTFTFNAAWYLVKQSPCLFLCFRVAGMGIVALHAHPFRKRISHVILSALHTSFTGPLVFRYFFTSQLVQPVLRLAQNNDLVSNCRNTRRICYFRHHYNWS